MEVARAPAGERQDGAAGKGTGEIVRLFLRMHDRGQGGQMKHRDLSSGKGTRDRLALFLSLSPLGPSIAWAHNGPAAVIDPTRRALLTAWSFRADVMLVMVVLTVVYTSGWWRLRNKGCRDTRRSWQAAFYLGGLMVLCVALLSPID